MASSGPGGSDLKKFHRPGQSFVIEEKGISPGRSGAKNVKTRLGMSGSRTIAWRLELSGVANGVTSSVVFKKGVGKDRKVCNVSAVRGVTPSLSVSERVPGAETSCRPSPEEARDVTAL